MDFTLQIGPGSHSKPQLARYIQGKLCVVVSVVIVLDQASFSSLPTDSGCTTSQYRCTMQNMLHIVQVQQCHADKAGVCQAYAWCTPHNGGWRQDTGRSAGTAEVPDYHTHEQRCLGRVSRAGVQGGPHQNRVLMCKHLGSLPFSLSQSFHLSMSSRTNHTCRPMPSEGVGHAGALHGERGISRNRCRTL